MRDADYIAVKERAAAHLLRIPHVRAVGLGGRERRGQSTGEIAIKVFVASKKPINDVPVQERIPSSFEHVPTDVMEMGTITRAAGVPGTTHIGALADIGPFDPLRGGVSISAEGKEGTGTLGCMLRDKLDGSAIYALTNHHVVVPGKNKLSRARRISHPSRIDPDQPGFVFIFDQDLAIGIVAEGRDEPILDAAVVRLNPHTAWIPYVEGIGYLKGHHELTLDDVKNNDYQVRKRGVKTGLTGGVVACIDAECLAISTEVEGVARKKNIFIRPNPAPPGESGQSYFSFQGDSGSAIVNDNNEVVGLLYAADEAVNLTTGGYGIAVPIGTVFRRLKEVGKLDLEVAVSPTADSSTTANDPNELRHVDRPAGVPTLTGVEQIAAGNHRHQRPLTGGVQIMAAPMLGDANSATLGCVVTETANPSVAYVLTSYGAVSAEGNIPPTDDTDVGQPNNQGSLSGCCSNTVGTFAKGGPPDGAPTAALVRLEDSQQWLAEIMHVGLVAGSEKPNDGEAVVKCGAASGLTGGVVTSVTPRPDGVRADAILIRPHSNPAKPDADVHFARFVDRGAAIVNGRNRVVGVLYDVVDIQDPGGRHVFHGVATPIDIVFEALKAHAGIEVEVAFAEQIDDVRRVSSRVTSGVDGLVAPVGPELRARRPRTFVLPDELLVTPVGTLMAAAWREHEREIRHLIDRNRRVATIWHRSGGPALLQAVTRAFHSPSLRLPTVVNGRPISACVDRLAQALLTYGSPVLRADIERIRPAVPSLGGLTYAELIVAFGAHPFAAVAASGRETAS